MDINKNKLSTMDPNILLSIVNMKLRDQYSSLKDLCQAYDIDEYLLSHRLDILGYEYDCAENQFKAK